ncbi:MAG: DUF6106 family protein [Eubacteriales bacterium]
MSEFYVEQLVPRKAAVGKITLIKNLCIAMTVLSVIGMFFVAILLYVAIILFVVDFFLMKQDNIEYEYLYLKGELDIDKVIAKQKRKHAYSLSMNDVIVVAQMDSGEVRPFQGVKTQDFSSGIYGPKVYKVILSKDNQNVAILIEPNEAILNGMKMVAPRKVFI